MDEHPAHDKFIASLTENTLHTVEVYFACKIV